MEEIWKDILGHEGRYQVSNLGKVRSLDISQDNPLTRGKSVRKGKILKPWLSKGYQRVGLSIGKKHKYYSVHVLVANTFVPKVEGKLHVNHNDGNSDNNRYDNLIWCTPLENVKHANEVLNRNPHNKLVFNTQNGIFYDSIKDASISLGRKNINPCYLGSMLKGTWKNRTYIITA